MSHRDHICAIIKDDGSILADDTDKANEFNRYFPSVGVADNDHLPVCVYVTTWSTVDYTSVTSIMHCRPCCNKLIS